MTFSEKIGYKVGSAIVKFKHWQVASWIKITVALMVLSLFIGLIYISSILIEIILSVIILALMVSSRNFKNIPLSQDNDEIDGFRNGHSGFGYYINDYYIEDEDGK